MGEQLEKAKLGWGEDMPDWVRILAMASDSTSHGTVSKQIGYSKAVISTAIKGTYPGDLKKLQTAVNANLMDAKVDCPIVGNIPLASCLKNQVPPQRYTNREQVKFVQSCPSCPNYQNGGK